MGLFDYLNKNSKEQTQLEIYEKFLNEQYYNAYTTPLQENKISAIIPLIKCLKEKNTYPFGTDDTLIYILDSYLNNQKEISFDTYYNQAKEIFDIILPLGRETTNSEQLLKMFETFFDQNGIFEQKLFFIDFYNLFQNKANYLLVMKKIIKEKNKLNKYLSILIDYAVNNREYFSSEEIFVNNIQSTIIELIKCISVKGDEKQLLKKLTTFNQKRIGIYDISQENLEYIDELLNDADGVLEQLKNQCSIANSNIEVLKHELQDSILKLKRAKDDEIIKLAKKQEELLSIFKNELLQITSSQTEKFTLETDRLINNVNQLIQEKNKDLKLISTKIEQDITLQLRRIRELGNETETKVKSLINENPELNKIVSEYIPIPELITKLDKVQEIVENTENKSSSIIHIPNPTIVIKEDIPKDINPYFDERIPFQTRYNQLEEKIHQNIENGELYHKKMPTLLKMIIEDCRPYLWGGSGVGKTKIVDQAFKLLELDYRPINKILEDYDLIGIRLPNGDFSNPLWYQCYKYGYGAFLDEFDSSNSEATIAVNSFTSKKKDSFYAFPNNEVVYRHPNFRIIAAGNTIGTGSDAAYTDRKNLDESVRERFMPLFLEPDEDIEAKLFGSYLDWAEFTRNFRKATNSYAKDRAQISAPGEITTRDMAEIAELKNDNAFTDEELMDLAVIQYKDEDYLSYLEHELDKIYNNENQTYSKKLYKIFKEKSYKRRTGDM